MDRISFFQRIAQCIDPNCQLKVKDHQVYPRSPAEQNFDEACLKDAFKQTIEKDNAEVNGYKDLDDRKGRIEHEFYGQKTSYSYIVDDKSGMGEMDMRRTSDINKNEHVEYASYDPGQMNQYILKDDGQQLVGMYTHVDRKDPTGGVHEKWLFSR